jgi:iron complex transport system substrate-binding protein
VATRLRGNGHHMRIVSLLPSATEILYAIGAGDRVVGVTHECDHPSAAADVPVVTRDLLPPGLSAVDIDAAVSRGVRDEHTIYALDRSALGAAHPDVVIAQQLCEACAVPVDTVDDALCTLASDAIVAAADPSTLDDLVPAIRVVGRAVDADAGAAALCDQLVSRLGAVATAVAGRAAPRVAVLEWPDPPWLPGHWVPDMVIRAGGDDLLGAAGAPSRRATYDELAAVDADVVVAAFCGFDLDQTIAHVDAIADRPGWTALVDGARVLAIDGSAYVSRPGPRLVDGVELLAWALHGVGAPTPDALAERRDGTWDRAAA